MLTTQEIEAMTPEEADSALIAVACVLPFLIAKARKARERRESDKSEWMALKEATAISGVGKSYFYDNWKKLGFCRKIGHMVMVNRKELSRWLSR